MPVAASASRRSTLSRCIVTSSGDSTGGFLLRTSPAATIRARYSPTGGMTALPICAYRPPTGPMKR